MNEEWWVFTFGVGQLFEGYYVRIWGTYESARKKMVDKYGLNWAFQYNLTDWSSMERNPNRYWPMEKLLEVIQ